MIVSEAIYIWNEFKDELSSAAKTNKVIRFHSLPSTERLKWELSVIAGAKSLGDRRSLCAVLCKWGATQHYNSELRHRYVHFMFHGCTTCPFGLYQSALTSSCSCFQCHLQVGKTFKGVWDTYRQRHDQYISKTNRTLDCYMSNKYCII